MPGFRTRTTWKMVVAAIGYAIWLFLLSSFVSALINDGGPIASLVWFLGMSGAGYVLVGNPGGLRDRLPITNTWVKVPTWGIASFIVVTAVTMFVPETPEYQARTAQKKAARQVERNLAAEAKAGETQKAGQNHGEPAQATETAPATPESPDKTPAASATKATTTPPSFSDLVRATVTKTLGQSTNMKSPRIRDVRTTPQVDASGVVSGYLAAITLNGDENLTTAMTRTGLLIDSADLLEALYGDAQLKDVVIEWQLPLTDVYGRTSHGRVMSFRMDAATAARIEWTGFVHGNLPLVSQDYWEHPALTKK